MFARYGAAPVTVNLLQVLTVPDAAQVAKQKVIQAAPDKNSRDKLKAGMATLTPNGIFSAMGDNNLIRHSGLIVIDIDLKGNEHLNNYSDLKNELCKIPNVAYCGLSVSGTGYWLLIPIAYPVKHKQHFEFIEQYFKSKGLKIDGSGKNVGRLRFYSYDCNAYFNHAAKPLHAYYRPPNVKAKEYKQKTFDTQNKPVWEQYNEGLYFIDVLKNHGWKIDSKKGNEKTYFTRPGKEAGISAEFDNRENVFFVFTDEGHPFETMTGYNPFQIYTMLDYAGDFSKAAKSLIPIKKKLEKSETFSKAPIPNTINLTIPVKEMITGNLEYFKSMALGHFERTFFNRDKSKMEMKQKYFFAWAQSMETVLINAGITPTQFLSSLNIN